MTRSNEAWSAELDRLMEVRAERNARKRNERKAFRAARNAGLAKRHARRLALNHPNGDGS